MNQLGKKSIEKNVFFQALPESPKPPPPPPPDPNSGNLVLFFQKSKFILKVSLELKILYILYNILYICNLKKKLKVQYIGIFEEIYSFY